MKVNISFNFDSVTSQVTELIVSPIDTVKKDEEESVIELNNNTLSIPKRALQALNLKPNSRIGVLVIDSDIVLLNPLYNENLDYRTYRVTNNNTIIIRGGVKDCISKVGNKFKWSPSSFGQINLEKFEITNNN